MTISASQKYGLAIHTTTPQLGIVLNNFAGDSRRQIWDLGRDLSSSLHKYLQEILLPQSWQDIDFIAVAKGPGGFTGTRIGVVAARTLGQQLDVPVYGISTLAAVAHSTLGNFKPDSLVAVQMNARREQLFVAIYKISSTGIWSDYLTDTTVTEQEWQKTLAQIEQPWQLVKAPSEIAHTVDSLLSLAYAQWKQGLKSEWTEVIPFYGQHPV
ncbi:Universal bacterial protein YeaZ [Hyella patelloides LEGE 07179]|uniref:Universal bacterial protein YeaZ n=1 Tax=Hyella patelloides LEGE 07179 TaxID=945734 RepID=A0A563VR70_9CYAN|nr:tRNA (adenosine(37)-N6)-threonylcarbamoyltransferase complex dimerization subunit type 1 TsaB [Hyella patelloides]VEP13904.1 Universal bacterial protein YeaZ [Hyella patelloides LEGE 07179]